MRANQPAYFIKKSKQVVFQHATVLIAAATAFDYDYDLEFELTGCVRSCHAVAFWRRPGSGEGEN